MNVELKTARPQRRVDKTRKTANARNDGTSDVSHVIDCHPYLAALDRFTSRPMPNPYRQTEAFISLATLASDDLPQTLRRALYAFRFKSNPEGVLYLKGLPQDSLLCPTPNLHKESIKSTYLSEFWLTAVSAKLGELIGYSQEQRGSLFQDIIPKRTEERLQSSAGSREDLLFHTETAFHPFLPTFLLLYCLRADHEYSAKTYYASVRQMLPKIPAKYRPVLFQKLFRTGIDHSFGVPAQEHAHGPIASVLYGNRYDPYLLWDQDLMTGLTAEAREALRYVTEAAEGVKREIVLKPGELLVIDNRRAVHARSRFTPRYDGKDRWLQRALVAADIGSSAPDRRTSERIIRTTNF